MATQAKPARSKYAEKRGADEKCEGCYVVEGTRVIEAHSGPVPSEEVVYRGCDAGSAHAVAQALALYWASRGLSIGLRCERYSVAPLSGRLASA